MKYVVVVEQKDANTFFAHIPDLPGCQFFSSSSNDALSGIQLEAQHHVEAIQKSGRPLPELRCFAADIHVSDPRLSRIQQFIEALLTREYSAGSTSGDELYQRLKRLPDDIEELVRDCKDLIEAGTRKTESDLLFWMLGGEIGSVKLDLASFIFNFVTTQPFFEHYMTVETAFPDDLPKMAEQSDPLASLLRLVELVLEKTAMINSGEHSDKAVCYYLYWMSKAASMMLTHTAAFDLKKIFDEDEYGEATQ